MTQKFHSLLLGFTSILCWASLASLGKILNHLPPFFVMATAFMIGGLLSLIQPKKMFPPLTSLLWGIGGLFGYHFFLFYAFRYAPVIEVNLINYLWPMLMMVLSPLFSKKNSFKKIHLFSIVFGIAGTTLLMGGRDSTESASDFLSSYRGYFLALLAAFTWPVYSLGRQFFRYPSIWNSGGICLITGILCALTHLILGPKVSLDSRDFLPLLLMGLGPFGVAFFCWDLALEKGSPQTLGALAYLTPVLSLMGLVLFADEILNWRILGAMALIIVGSSFGLLDFLLPSKPK
jgi:drug/metabolite transporter (DMT)-like permease